LYNQLLQIEYSPITALNRTYALSKVAGKENAIKEALKLDLKENRFYHSLLGNLNTGLDNKKAIFHFEMAYKLAKSNTDKMTIEKYLNKLK
jgi:RNA polymerase sigma-70 factor (ECF subfamily)